MFFNRMTGCSVGTLTDILLRGPGDSLSIEKLVHIMHVPRQYSGFAGQKTIEKFSVLAHSRS